MAILSEPFALDRSLNTTEGTPRNLADVLAQALQALTTVVSGLNFINAVVVAELPSVGISTTTIYLVPSDDPQSENIYDEYINLDGTSAGWEKIGSTEIDLSNYYTKTETDTLLSGKVDKEAGKGLSTNDYTDAEKTKLAGIESGAEVNVQSDWNQADNTADDFIKNKPSSEVKSATDTFTTVNGGLLEECNIELEPIQDLHGYDYPWVGGAGKNKLDASSLTWTSGYLDDDGNLTPSDYSHYSSEIPIKSNQTYTISGSLYYNVAWRIYFRDTTHAWIERTTSLNVSSYTFSTPANCGYIQIQCENAVVLSDVQLEEGNQATSYAPYSNICPISGHTEVKIDVTHDGNTDEVTQSLGTTVYGGTLDVVSGKLVINKKKRQLTGTGEVWNKSGTYAGNFYTSWQYFPDGAGKQNAYIWCSHAERVASLSDFAYGKCYSDNSLSIWLGTADMTTAQWVQYLNDLYTSGNPVEVCYEVDTPVTIQLTPEQIETFVGENTISLPLDGQTLEGVKYKELFTWNDVKEYVNAHIGSGMNYSAEEQVVGTWFGKTLYQKTVDQTINADSDYTVFASGIDHAHLVNSCFEYSSGRWMSFDYVSLGATSNNRTCYVDVQNGALNLHNQAGSSIRWIATIQYTKSS